MEILDTRSVGVCDRERSCVPTFESKLCDCSSHVGCVTAHSPRFYEQRDVPSPPSSFSIRMSFLTARCSLNPLVLLPRSKQCAQPRSSNTKPANTSGPSSKSPVARGWVSRHAKTSQEARSRSRLQFTTHEAVRVRGARGNRAGCVMPMP